MTAELPVPPLVTAPLPVLVVYCPPVAVLAAWQLWSFRSSMMRVASLIGVELPGFRTLLVMMVEGIDTVMSAPETNEPAGVVLPVPEHPNRMSPTSSASPSMRMFWLVAVSEKQLRACALTATVEPASSATKANA